MSNICLLNTYFCYILAFKAFKRQASKLFTLLSNMGMNAMRISNFKEGGTHKEPRCEFLFVYHNDDGFVYRKGK